MHALARSALTALANTSCIACRRDRCRRSPGSRSECRSTCWSTTPASVKPRKFLEARPNDLHRPLVDVDLRCRAAPVPGWWCCGAWWRATAATWSKHQHRRCLQLQRQPRPAAARRRWAASHASCAWTPLRQAHCASPRSAPAFGNRASSPTCGGIARVRETIEASRLQAGDIADAAINAASAAPVAR